MLGIVVQEPITFNTTMDVSTLPVECKDGCIYTKMGLGKVFDADVGEGGGVPLPSRTSDPLVKVNSI